MTLAEQIAKVMEAKGDTQDVKVETIDSESLKIKSSSGRK